MNKTKVIITDEEIDAALERGKSLPDRTTALLAEYNREANVIVFRLSTGRRFLIPREELQGLESATPAQLADIQIHAGVGIAWPQLGVDHYLPYLLEGRYGSDRWMQSLYKGARGAVAA